LAIQTSRAIGRTLSARESDPRALGKARHRGPSAQARRAPPILVGDVRVPESHRTIAFYAHYDGQPVDVRAGRAIHGSRWCGMANGRKSTGARPNQSIPSGAFTARSAGDDKTPIIGMLAALDALRAAGLKPAVNLRLSLKAKRKPARRTSPITWRSIPTSCARQRGYFATGRSIKAGGWNFPLAREARWVST